MRFISAGPNDVLALSIDDEVLLRVDADVQGETADFEETYAAYVGNYAGSTVLVQITLWGTGQADSQVLIDNLRFIKTTMAMAADVNIDEQVNFQDFAQMQGYWMTPDCGAVGGCNGNDITGDGSVDIDDIIQLSEFWLWKKPSPILGDIDQNRSVDYADFSILSDYWNAGCQSPDWCELADVDRNGVVDLVDATYVIEHWLMSVD